MLIYALRCEDCGVFYLGKKHWFTGPALRDEAIADGWVRYVGRRECAYGTQDCCPQCAAIRRDEATVRKLSAVSTPLLT